MKGAVIFNGKTHLIVGAFTGFIICSFFGFSRIFIIFAMFGSILPDIDEIHTILGRFNILAWLGVMEHRGITHTLLASLLFGLFFSIGGIDAGLCLWVGYLSHLWLDSKTPMGIRWLYPLKK